MTLAALAAIAGVVWLVVLPIASRRPHFERRWQRAEQAGIDPAALNYRELPLAEGIYADLQELQSVRPEVWAWPK